MSEDVFDLYSQYFKQATEEIGQELLEVELLETVESQNEGGKKLDVIVGISGEYKGRLLLETSLKSALKITETMNFGALDEADDLYMFMGEFVNMLSGRAITFLNNLDKEKIVRLTPPAIFSGYKLDISTPNIQTRKLYFSNDGISIKLDIGFEGV